MIRIINRVILSILKFSILSLFVIGSHAQATTVGQDFDLNEVDRIPGLTGFKTLGSDMIGLAVTARFDDGLGNVLEETIIWVDDPSLPDAGGVAGTGWEVSLSGDTDTNLWKFINKTSLPLIDLILDGRSGLTVFDRAVAAIASTPGSDTGRDYLEDPDQDGTAVYSRAVAIGNADPLFDIWHVLSINFGQQGISTNEWMFLADTDNDSRISVAVPEPANILLVSLALIGIGGRNLRKKRAGSLK